ncbi:MAG: glycosyltransferase [Pyrobaculum sp.]|jgi:glycosyltransferase involved in cell wall biosynthesis|nr:glycosyltransferase [Pyrobaculum sp.]
MIYDIVYVIDIASTTSGGNKFFVELAAEAAKTYKVALIAGKTTPEARRLLAGVDLYDGGIYGDCELPHTCPLKAAKFLIYATKVLTSIKFRLLHTNAHLPNLLAYLHPRRTIATIHHLEPASLHPLARLIQILELKAPKLALHAPHEIAPNAVVIPPILRHTPPQIQHTPRQRGLVVMIGRLEPRKNYPLALAAFKVAKTLRPDLKLVIIGDGPLRRDLHRTIERLGLQDVEIKPHATEEEKHQLLAQAEAFLHLGHPEGFSLALFEAATLGAPVITHPQVPAATLLKTPNILAVELHPTSIAKALLRPPPPAKPLNKPAEFAHIYLALYRKLSERLK